MIQDKVREELTPRDATYLADLLKKDKNSITPAERELLVARRDYLTEETLAKYDITGPEIKEEVVAGAGTETTDANKSKYDGVSFADLKKDAKERGIKLTNTLKMVDVVALLEQFDGLKDGDEFQGQIAKLATQEMIDENNLVGKVEVGQLVFIDKEDEEVK